MLKIKSETVMISVNNKKVPAVMSTYTELDNFPTIGEDFDFGDDDANQKYLARFESGELVNLNVFVEIECMGLKGYASLGGVHAKDDNDALDVAKEYNLEAEATEALLAKITKVVEAVQC